MESSSCPMDQELYGLAKKRQPGATDQLERLLRERPDVLNGVTPLGDTALHVAVLHGNLGFARSIYKHHWQLLLRPNLSGDTPLHLALENSGVSDFHDFTVQCISFLEESHQKDLERGGVPTNCLVNKAGKSLLYLAAERGTAEMVKSLVSSRALCGSCDGPNGMTALHAAVLHRSADISWELLRHQVQLVKKRDDNGNTPLHLSICLDEGPVTLLLPENDDSAPYILNNDGLSPLHLAACLGVTNGFSQITSVFPETAYTVTGTYGRTVLL